MPKIHVGKRGGRYQIKNGKKCYCKPKGRKAGSSRPGGALKGYCHGTRYKVYVENGCRVSENS